MPQVITHKVTAPIPNNVLAPSPEMEREVPAMVVEVTKDHKHNPDMPLHSVAVVPSVHPVEGVVLSLPDVMVTTAQPIEVPVVMVSTASPVVKEVSKVPVHPAEVPGVVVSMVTSETPVVNEVAKVPVDTVVQHVIKERSVDDEATEEGSGHVVNVEPVVDVVTMLLEDVEVTTNLSGEETTTVKVEDEDMSTTMVPLVDDVVDDKEMSTVDPDSMDNVTDLVAEEVVTVVAVKEHDHLVPVTEVVNVHSTEKSSEDSSDEEDDSSSSSSESPKDLLVPEILNHAHSKDEVTVPHVPVSPPINVDTRDHSSSSSEDVNEDVQETVRRRRAVPFSDKINLATARPKLVTDPKVIANILSKSNTVKLHRAMRSVVDDEKTAMKVDDKAPVSVSEPVDTMENVDRTPVSVTVLEPVTKTADDMMPSVVTINPCDLLCTKFEIDPICASNGLCLHEFPNQCMLDTYNCKHPREKFSATRDERCQMSWLDFCKESDLV